MWVWNSITGHTKAHEDHAGSMSEQRICGESEWDARVETKCSGHGTGNDLFIFAEVGEGGEGKTPVSDLQGVSNVSSEKTRQPTGPQK
jgi:hypothetical protein